MATEEPRRVDLTDNAASLLRRLTLRHRPLMFHQSGGCCDGSSPMCYPDGEFQAGDADVLIRSRLMTDAELEHFQLAA